MITKNVDNDILHKYGLMCLSCTSTTKLPNFSTLKKLMGNSMQKSLVTQGQYYQIFNQSFHNDFIMK